MLLYFVRHGETVCNRTRIHQGADDPLTELGEKQGHYVARKLKNFPIEFILTSNFIRAKRTAEIINTVLNLEMEVSPLVREVLHPSAISGLSYDNPESLRVRKLVAKNTHNPNWHYGDEENFTDYTKRAQEFLASIESYPYEHILVVTHGSYLKVLIGVMLFGEEFTPELYNRLFHFLYKTNTGISIAEKSEASDSQWQLKTWNDYAHVKEIEEKSHA